MITMNKEQTEIAVKDESTRFSLSMESARIIAQARRVQKEAEQLVIRHTRERHATRPLFLEVNPAFAHDPFVPINPGETFNVDTHHPLYMPAGQVIKGMLEGIELKAYDSNGRNHTLAILTAEGLHYTNPIAPSSYFEHVQFNTANRNAILSNLFNLHDEAYVKYSKVSMEKISRTQRDIIDYQI